MEPPRPGGSRKNAIAAAVVLAAVALIAAIPALWGRYARPAAEYASVAEARAAGALEGDGPIPAALVPPSAIDIREKHDAGGGRVWLRYAADPREVDALTAPLRRLPVEEVSRLEVPNPGYAKWWLLSSRTLSGSQGRVLRVYEAPRGYLAVDPRSSIVYYWSR